MPRAHEIPADERSLREHYLATIRPIESLKPMLDGALYYTPPSLCDSNPESGEKLTDQGVAFMTIVYELVCDAQRYASEGAGCTKPTSEAARQFSGVAYEVQKDLTVAVFITRAMIAADLPVDVSDAHGMEKVRDTIQAALDRCSQLEALANQEAAATSTPEAVHA